MLKHTSQEISLLCVSQWKFRLQFHDCFKLIKSVPLPKGDVQPCPVSGLTLSLCKFWFREWIRLKKNPAGVFLYRGRLVFKQIICPTHLMAVKTPEEACLISEVCYKDAPYISD